MCLYFMSYHKTKLFFQWCCVMYRLCTRWPLNGGWIRGGFPPSFLCHFLFNIPVPRSADGFFINPPTEGALPAGLVSVAVEQCVMQLGTGGRWVRWGGGGVDRVEEGDGLCDSSHASLP